MTHFTRLQRSLTGLAVGLMLTGAGWAQCPTDDSFEENDDCASAAPLAAGLTTGLVARGPVATGGFADNDYYVITVPPGNQLTVDALFTHSPDGDINMFLWNVGCTDFLSGSFSFDDNESVTWSNGDSVAVDYVVMVRTQDPNFDCKDYSLQVTIAPDPCLAPGVDDGFEPNNDCAGPLPSLATGVHPGLYLATFSPDHYSISVPPQEIVTVQVTFDASQVDIGASLLDPVCGFGSPFDQAPNMGGAGMTTWTLEYTNGSLVAEDVVLHVYEGTFGDSKCGNYDLSVSTAPSPCFLPGADDSLEENDDCASAVTLAMGLHPGLHVAVGDSDFYKVSVAPGNRFDPSLVTTGLDVNLVAWEVPTTCPMDSFGYPEDYVAWVTSDGSGNPVGFGWTNSSVVSQDLYLMVWKRSSGFCDDYSLDLFEAPDPCLAPGVDDGLEDNDDCASAVSLASGLHTGLFVSRFDPDFYRVTVPAYQDLVVQATYSPGSADFYINAVDTGCTQVPYDSFVTMPGVHDFTYSNTAGVPVDVILDVFIQSVSPDNCVDYNLDVSFVSNPCLGPGTVDSFEPNQLCFSASPITPGTYTGLNANTLDEDWYQFDAAPGELITVRTLFSHASGDLDLELYEQSECTGSWMSAVAWSASVTDDEMVQWFNMTGSTQTYLVKVAPPFFGEGTVAVCNDYDLELSVGADVESFCAGDGTTNVGGGMVGCPCGNESAMGAEEGCQSSLGYGATLEDSGSSLVSLDNLALKIQQARPMQPALVVQGSTLIAIPFKDGLLCMGNPTERLEVMFTDATGSATTAGSIVTNGNVSPGDVRYYQCWYRDPGGVSPCGSGSNFSSGVLVNWQ